MEGIDLGPILLRWNGLLIMLGVVLGGIVASLEAKHRGYDSEIVLDLLLPFMIWGTIGARLWHIFTPPLSSVQLGLTTRHYLTHPLDMIALWVGGLGFPGALIGGIVALFFFCRKNEIDFAELADILAPSISFGQAIGRIGNFFNQELYGLPTSLPWKIFINPEHRLRGYTEVGFYHPLFAYEVILNLANFFLLYWISRKYSERLQKGGLFLIYLVNYAVIRFGLEFVRLDVAMINGVNINQVFVAMLALVSGGIFYFRSRSLKKL